MILVWMMDRKMVALNIKKVKQENIIWHALGFHYLQKKKLQENNGLEIKCSDYMRWREFQQKQKMFKQFIDFF